MHYVPLCVYVYVCTCGCVDLRKSDRNICAYVCVYVHMCMCVCVDVCLSDRNTNAHGGSPANITNQVCSPME